MDMIGAIDSQPNMPDPQVNNTPYIGMKFGTEKEAYDFYNLYGGTVGFSIRRECAHKDKEDKTIIKSRRFLCNKAGRREVDKRDKGVKKHRPESRVNCLAKMCISRLPEGDYICREFVEDHNHELHTLDTRQFLRSQRTVTDMQGVQIDMADDVGIRPKATYEYMGKHAGGIQNVGYTIVDLRNYLRTKRESSLQYGEAGALNDYFVKQQKLNPSFTYRLQYDSEEMVTNIFWADPRMLIDYALFGDVVVFDTTFCTNKENRPLGVFSGFNHHRGATIFGAALLYDETTDSFKWLFETFLEVHGHRKPKTIFTDQDAAMGNAIAEVMPDTVHGLCTWHIVQNGMKHLANLMKGDRTIMKEFRRCMYDIEEEDKFEKAWQQMYVDHEISNNSWLNRIYGLRKKWARCYMRQTFTAGVRSTQLSESMNSDLKDYLRRTLDLKQFFTQFERVVASKRANELKADFDARNTRPSMAGITSPILTHAGKVYTPAIYSKFEKQYKWITYCLVHKCDDTGEVVQYRINVVDEDGELMEQFYQVGFMQSGPFVVCNCRYFETVGILCTHALRVLEVKNIKRIPERYILPRWTRTVRSTIVEDTTGIQIVEDTNVDSTQAFQLLCPPLVKLSEQACTSAAGIVVLKNITENFRFQLAALQIDSPPAMDLVLNEPRSTELVLKKKEKHKGSSRRHKSWLDSMGKGKKRSNIGNQSSFDEGQSQQNSQELLHPPTMQWAQPTVNTNTFTGFLSGSSHLPNYFPYPCDGYYHCQPHITQGSQSQSQTSLSVPQFPPQQPDGSFDG